MKNLINKKILLVICGGIAAYKSLELIRIFKKNKCQVKTILTKGAPLVNIVLTWHLFFLKILISSKDLYAAIPPQITNNIFLLIKFFISELKYYDR